MKQTTHCVYCLKAKAVVWFGYVTKPRAGARPESILAGWCKRHRDAYNNSGKLRSWVGIFLGGMGAEEIR